ncbi:hypothetical protein HZA86_02115 [Candidatus Uhrbacteria bacterium]|nr:hypothetical protein [Candidatus Uhrbacteria bacterium]
MYLFVLPLEIIASIFVYRDARKLQRQGFTIHPGDTVFVLLVVQAIVGISFFIGQILSDRFFVFTDFTINLVVLFIGIIAYFFYQRSVQQRGVPAVAMPTRGLSPVFDSIVFILVLIATVFGGMIGAFIAVWAAADGQDYSYFWSLIVGLTLSVILETVLGIRIWKKIRHRPAKTPSQP